MTTDYHAQYLAYELTKRCASDSVEKLAGAVAGAQVDLNPHQVDAALFAFNSPLSKGALLADEVGLGKTIEAGLVLSQKWAEKRRRILVVVPSIRRTISERNARFFEAEAEKLEGWADDLKLGLEREIKEIDRQIKNARRTATTALTLEEKLAGQKQIKALESHRNEKRRSLFEAQDRMDAQRETLIATIEAKLDQNLSSSLLFSIRWTLN